MRLSLEKKIFFFLLTWSSNRQWCRCRRSNGHWSWSSNRYWGRRGQGDWRVVSHLGLEGVTVDVGCLADNLVADVLVADDRVSGLDGLQNGGWTGNCVHGWRLRNQSLLVDRGERRHGRNGWHSGYGGRRKHGASALTWRGSAEAE